METLKYAILIIFLIAVHLSAQDFIFPITVSDGVVSHTINIGLNANATDGYDAGIDALAPPAPPAGSFDTRLNWQGNEYFTDIRDTSIVLKTFPISYRPATGNAITLYWNNLIISTYGVFTIVDNPLNQQFSLDMSTVDSLDITTSSFITDSLKIIVNPGGLVGIENNNPDLPSKFSLYQNYPNPFNPQTTIQFELPKADHTELIIYNSQGEVVDQLINTYLKTGIYTYTWSPKSIASGVYFYRIKSGKFIDIKKMTYFK